MDKSYSKTFPAILPLLATATTFKINASDCLNYLCQIEDISDYTEKSYQNTYGASGQSSVGSSGQGIARQVSSLLEKFYRGVLLLWNDFYSLYGFLLTYNIDALRVFLRRRGARWDKVLKQDSIVSELCGSVKF